MLPALAPLPRVDLAAWQAMLRVRWTGRSPAEWGTVQAVEAEHWPAEQLAEVQAVEAEHWPAEQLAVRQPNPAGQQAASVRGMPSKLCRGL